MIFFNRVGAGSGFRKPGRSIKPNSIPKTVSATVLRTNKTLNSKPQTTGPLTTYEAPCESVLYHRLVRYDLESGAVTDESIVPESTFFISEPTIVPKIGGR